ncbi:MAG: hypothetical protein ACPG31_02380 [Planctomycetota bacterium]
MKKFLVIPLLCLATSCGSDETTPVILDAPCPTDGRRVQILARDIMRQLDYDYEGGLVSWDDSWVSIQTSKESIIHIPTMTVYHVREMANYYN